MDQRYNVYNIEPKFRLFLLAENISKDTIKNYLSDIRHFTGWLKNESIFTDTHSFLDITEDLVTAYKSYLTKNNVAIITINRRLSSLRKYFDFFIKENLISTNPARKVPNIPKSPYLNINKQSHNQPETISSLTETKRESYTNISGITRYKGLITRSLLAVFLLFLVYNSGSMFISKYSKKNTPATKVVELKKGRILTFRGKLFDNLGNPITSKTDITLKIYSNKKALSPIYTGQCKGVNGITPDIDGTASVIIGKDCNMNPIPQSVFSENPDLYLGVSIGSDKELSPRQQIANAAYSLDSERLQGMELGSSTGSVPYIDDNGTIHIEASESSIVGHSPEGTFSIKSDGALLLQSGDQQDVVLMSGLSGSLKFKTGGFSDSVSNLYIGSEGNVGIGTEDPSDFKVQVAGDIGPDSNDIFNLGSESKQWSTVYSSKFLQNGVALCDEQGNNCPKNISSWTLSSPYLYTNQSNTRIGIGTSDTSAIISKLFVTKDPGDTATGKALAIFNQTENQDILTASASGQTRFVVKNDGNTGIGTINPSARLDVSGGQTKIEVSTQYTQRLCHSGLDTTSTQNVVLGDCATGGADIAEYYGSQDTSLEAGDVVIAAKGGQIIGKNSVGYIEKSNTEYDTRVIGIVSTNPYDSFGNNFEKNQNALPVALAGRIPVKISQKSASIKAGDLLTSSEEPGKAMKAIKAGQIIGKALEDWSPEQAKKNVLMFVNISWSDPQLSIASSGKLVEHTPSSSFVYDGVIKNEENQITIFNKILERATEEEKNLLIALWQTTDLSAEKAGSILDIAYSKAQNSLTNSVLNIQNLFVSNKIQSPIIETTDLVATGSSRLSQVHTNNINTDGKDIEINLESVDATDSASQGPLAQLIIKGTNGSKAASIDAEGNATFSGTLAANSASISGQLAARSLSSESLQSNSINGQSVSTNSLNSQDATISGTLIANNIQSDTIKALEQRINSLVDSSSKKSTLPASQTENGATSSDSATIASNNNSNADSTDTNNESINTKEIQKLIAQLKNASIPDPQYYHIPDTIQNTGVNGSNTSNLTLSDQMEKLNLEDLTVTGNANFYKLNAAQSIAVGTMIIENDTILSLADNLNISALSTISLFDGAVTIARDGTMTTKGAIIARSGVKTNTIEAIDKNVVVKLASHEGNPDKLVIANAAGNETASIDASGSAQFDEISLNKYMDATSSGALISAEDNLEKHGVFAPAFNAEKKAAGIGIIPENSSEIVIFTDKIKQESLVYLTPTEQITNGQLSILEKETCSDKPDGCKPYFRVGISNAEHRELMFNWLIIN